MKSSRQNIFRPESTQIHARKKSRLIHVTKECHCTAFNVPQLRLEFIGSKKEMEFDNLYKLKKNRMFAVLICHFVFPSYATTSPMRIATIHSVHLPLFLDFVGIYFIPTGHSNCFYTKNQFLFCYLPDFSPDFFRFLSISLHSCHFSVDK